MSSPSTKNSGCAWLFVFGLFAFILAVLINYFAELGFVPTLVLSFFVSLWVTQKLMGPSDTTTLFKNIVRVFLVVVLLRFLFFAFLNYLRSNLREDQGFQIEEGVGTSYILEAGDTITVYSSHRVWKDNYGNGYTSNLTVRERDFLRLYNHVNSFKPIGTENFWGRLYDYIERTDSPSLDLVVKAFESIREEQRLNTMEFAEMIVSCVQDIPYSFVFQDECLSPEHYEEAIRAVLEVCPDCCIGNKTFGIQNPVSFLQNLKGDCDTRTVLVYTLLKHFGYDVAILNSDFYLHSIIGINLPANGSHKIYHGKRYYVWETTAKNYTVGQLPNNFSDLTHWNVILTSN